MNFGTPALVEDVLYDLRQADQPRSTNRGQIDRLFSGFPPWTPEEVTANQISCNCNFLDAPKLAADARRSYFNAFLKPKNYFSMALDSGPRRSRASWAAIVTHELNRIMKSSLPYFEMIRNQVASTVLHGIGPVHWSDEFSWRPRSLDIADLMVPSNTLLSLENLDYFGIFRQYTGPELHNKIERANVDPGWNLDLARKAVRWVESQTSGQGGTGSQNDWMSWEKVVDRMKEDSVYYGSDMAPTVDCWDFYYRSDEGKQSGWRRCMVLDTPAANQVFDASVKPSKNLIGEENSGWLYNGGERIYAEDINQILHFQFGDLSAKAPFKYHSVRSLGWLIYAVCNLQNRLRCKINDATFENLLNYFRITGPDDRDRLTKINLHNYGTIPDGVEFVKQQDRWQVNQNLVQGTMADNRQMLNEAAAQFREGRDTQQSGVEKTATQIMAEVNSANALVGSMLLLAYIYQKGQHREIVRRFFKENSTDKDVREFRLRVLKQGVPAEILNLDYWDVAPEQVLGSGNKMLQIAMADKLMQVRPMLDPDSQRDALRLYVEANSDDAGLGSRWVPDKPILVTESAHDAQLMVGTIMAGVTVEPTAGQDAGQMATALLKAMAEICQRILNTANVPSSSELFGLTNLAGTIEKYVARLSQDQGHEELAKQTRSDLVELTKIVQKWSGEVQQQQQQQAPGQDPEAAKEAATTQEKLKAIALTAQTKAKITQANAAQKQQQRDTQFQQKQQQSEEAHTADLRKKLRETEVATTIADVKAASEIRNTPKPEPAAQE
jgi:hypothetical protein